MPGILICEDSPLNRFIELLVFSLKIIVDVSPAVVESNVLKLPRPPARFFTGIDGSPFSQLAPAVILVPVIVVAPSPNSRF